MVTAASVLLADMAKNCVSIPSSFKRPISDRPNLNDVKTSGASIPLIDLQGLAGPDRDEVIKEIEAACLKDGFFRVKNHGIPESVIDGMLRVSREFFHLPESERVKNYSDDPMKTTRLSTSFNIKNEKFGCWRDYLRLHCHPLEDFVNEWPANPPCFRQVVSEYCKHVRQLALSILEAISESLGLERDFINKVLGSHAQHMAMNYYPPCPQPELTYGLPGHKDPNVITLLLQDGVSGLQVLRDGQWAAVSPEPYNLTVNLGDQMQVLSNGRYNSVLHRAVVNSNSERISVATFYCPSPDAVMEPPRSLVDEEHPSIYGSYTYAEYYQKFWDHGLNSESCLIDMFKGA